MEKSFSRTLKSLRNQHAITQAEMADKLHVSRSCIANYEKGSRQPDIDAAGQIAELFHVSLDYLLGKTEKSQVTTQKTVPTVLDLRLLAPEEKAIFLRFYQYLRENAL